MCQPEKLFSKVIASTIGISNILRVNNIQEDIVKEIEYHLAVIEGTLHNVCLGRDYKLTVEKD